MNDLFDGMFAETISGLKVKNLDTASLHEIIDEFAPLLTGDAVARPKRIANKTDADALNSEPDHQAEDMQEEMDECSSSVRNSPEALRIDEECSETSSGRDETDSLNINVDDSIKTEDPDNFKTDEADGCMTKEAEMLKIDETDSFKTSEDGALDLSLYSSREESDVFTHPTSVINGDHSIKESVSHSSSSFQNHSIAHSKTSFQDYGRPKLDLDSAAKQHNQQFNNLTNGEILSNNSFLLLQNTGTASALDHLSKLKNGLTKLNQDNFLLTPNLNHMKILQSEVDKSNTLSDIRDVSKFRLRGLGRYKIYQCEHCSAVFDTKYHLNRHMMISHEGVHPFVCEVCSKAFAQKCDLTRHMNVHYNVKKHYCKVCGKSFKRADYLAKHEKEFCSVFRPHKCEKCGRCYANQEELDEHLVSHDVKLPFWCDKCDDSFQEEADLVEHKKQHQLDKPQECPKCHKSFPEFKDFVTHYKEHSGERPYRCALCNKVFTRNHNLMTHLWIHNKQKSHKCVHCGKSFTYYSNLQVHLRIHTGERPYVCGECNKSFLTSSDLRRHHRVHSGDKPYICKTCKMAFTRKERLMLHRNKENH